MDTTKKTPKISNYPTTQSSPFIVELTSRLFTPKPEHRYMQGDDGKEYGMYEIPRGRMVNHDPAVYCKHYKGISSILMSLSEPASKMYHYVHEHLEVNSDQVCILMDDYLQFSGYKSTNRLNYYRAIEGLLAAGIIARMTGSTTCFYINPNILFNGDRTKLKNIRIVNDSDRANTDGIKKSFRFTQSDDNEQESNSSN